MFTDYSCVKLTTQCPKLPELGGLGKPNLSPGSVGLPLQGKQAATAESSLMGGLAPLLIQPDNLSVCTNLKLCKCQTVGHGICAKVCVLPSPPGKKSGR